MKFKFNSVVFTSSRIPELRAFYEGKLGFPTGTYEKNGERLPDFSETYVNYHIAGGLIGFEHEHGKDAEFTETSRGDIILNVAAFDAFREKVNAAGIPIIKEHKFFFMISDPDGRTLIFEPDKN
jgi:catechol 2,3-dioxygenase-like lactoylglutathione lyase family enzyme